jgi:DNA modification methylase
MEQQQLLPLEESDTELTSIHAIEVELLQGNCLKILNTLKPKSVNCCITSPPYYGLRDYETASWIGGDINCTHENPRKGKPTWGEGSTGSSTLSGKPSNDSHSLEGFKGRICPLCGAKRVDAQIGLESTPEEYIEKMVKVFSEVKRVLKDDGTLWIVIGDSYNGSGGEHKHDQGQSGLTNNRNKVAHVSGRNIDYLKPKDLIGIPWMLAFALRADGWYLRQDIIWAKGSPMPESVKDRCTKSHEYIFLLSKSKKYFYDADAIKETSKWNGESGNKNYRAGQGRINAGMNSGNYSEKRNKRSVWTVNSTNFPEAHFATFPPKLIVPMIKAGCPVGGTVLDPFFGSGTTGLVSRQLGRKCIGIELNPKYCKIAKNRLL